MSENGQTKLLESNKSKVEEIKMTSSQIRNLFTWDFEKNTNLNYQIKTLTNQG